MRRSNLASILLALVAVFFLSAGKTPEFSRAEVGDKAPAFEVTTLAGEKISVEQMQGKVLLVNFFATWCGPCKQEMPHLDKEIFQQLKHDDFVMVTIGREHSDEEVAEFKAEFGYDMPFAADPKRAIYSQYAEKMIPRSVVIGKDGVIKWHSSGYRRSEFQQMKTLIKDELDKS